ncbi:hypothetical protein ACFP1C_00200 [Levilactobacillus fujinensis]|uniref:Uncharacterized protein n=1 Tax=Levilactobacillus fujinensis TaxID=2486024 RepID=A0ABW1TD19_9LACO
MKTAALRLPGIPLAVGNASSQRTGFRLAASLTASGFDCARQFQSLNPQVAAKV